VIDLVTRRSYFDDYADTIEDLPPSLVQYEVRYSCPGCGYPTLRDRGLGEVCYLCHPEDEQQLQREIRAAFDEMQTTPMADHERLWADVLAKSQELRSLR
jgi:hypothetical protein